MTAPIVNSRSNCKNNLYEVKLGFDQKTIEINRKTYERLHISAWVRG